MYLKKEFFLIFVTLLIINSCSTTNTKTIPPIAVTVETPNCPTSKCRLRYSTSSKIYDVTPPLPVIVEPLNADLYVACYDDRSQGNIKSIVVGTSYRKIIHPLDCSSNVITDVITDDTNNDEIKTETETETEAEAEAETLENVVSLRKYIKKEKEVRSEKSSESPDQKGSNKDKLPSTEEENLNGETEESAEEREKKEKLAKEMMDQIDALYKQGLITKEAYEREKIIILNITK